MAKKSMTVLSEDRISGYLNAKKLVPKQFQSSDKFLDVVSWNIRYFDHQDPKRVKDIADVMDALNADVFVLTEIAEDGALDEVVDILGKRKAGYYSLQYGSTGGQQRVTLMWDRDWVRTKEEPQELFADVGTVTAENGIKAQVFPRLPLWGYFEARSDKPKGDDFTFELLGVHLKSQMPAKGWKPKTKGARFGTKQRLAAADALSTWLIDKGEHVDEDILIVGDWNAATNLEEWEPIRDLEDSDGVVFSDINKLEPTHLARLNKSGAGGTRLDLHLITKAADANAVPKQKGVVIQWSFFDDLEGLAAPESKALYKALRERISDHLPVVSRFYLTDAKGDG